MTDTLGPTLTFDEVRKLVAAASPCLELRIDGAEPGKGKGRYLVARRALAAGEIVLRERPLFRGSTDGYFSKKACNSEFLALVSEELDRDRIAQEDFLHPRSPLMDCLASYALTKCRALHGETEAERARATLQIRKLGSLCRTQEEGTLSPECAKEILGALRPELADLLSESEVVDTVNAVCSNRFAADTEDAMQLDLMFAASMCEHSCVPNCFVGSLGDEGSDLRTYRTLHDVAAGAALAIDYLSLPDCYLDTARRAELISKWGFICTCPRCTASPELTRSFVCEACRAPELCPRVPEAVELVCRTCGLIASTSYADRCFAAEASIYEPRSTDESGETLFSRFHHFTFEVAWSVVAGHDAVGNTSVYSQALELLVESIIRLYGSDRHPQLVFLHHALAELRIGDQDSGSLEAQLQHLAAEEAVIAHCYPEDAQRQQDETWKNLRLPDELRSGAEPDIATVAGTCFGAASACSGIPGVAGDVGADPDAAAIAAACAGLGPSDRSSRRAVDAASSWSVMD